MKKLVLTVLAFGMVFATAMAQGSTDSYEVQLGKHKVEFVIKKIPFRGDTMWHMLMHTEDNAGFRNDLKSKLGTPTVFTDELSEWDRITADGLAANMDFRISGSNQMSELNVGFFHEHGDALINSRERVEYAIEFFKKIFEQ